jgi:hypothetical protein
MSSDIKTKEIDVIDWAIQKGKYYTIGATKVFNFKSKDVGEFAKFYHEEMVRELKESNLKSECVRFATWVQDNYSQNGFQKSITQRKDATRFYE